MISADELMTDEEKLAAAARFTAAVKRADRLALYGAVVAGLLMAYFVYGYLGSVYEWVWEYAVPMLTFVFGASLIAKHVVKVIMYRVDDIADLPLFGSWSGNRRPAAATAIDSAKDWPIEVAAPRLDPSQPARGIHVLTSALRDGPSVFVTHGGRATTRADQLPLGVAAMTEQGFVFYPDANAQSVQALSELKSVAWELAKDSFKVLGVLGALGVGDSDSGQASVPEWVERSRAHPEFFSFAWTELVAVKRYGQNVVRMSHEAADQTRAEHVFVADDPSWPVLLMKIRLERDLADTLNTAVRQPKTDELAPALLEQFRGVYGDRVSEHATEMYAELQRRVNESLRDTKVPLDEIAKKGLAPVLPHFAKHPKIVESFSILFDQKSPPV